MASIELLKQMDPAHAINTLRAEFDPLLNTPLEAFLIDQLEQLHDAGEGASPLLDAADEYGIEPEDIKTLGEALIEDAGTTAALLKLLSERDFTDAGSLRQALDLVAVLDDAGIDSVKELQAHLDLARRFRALAEDAGDVFSRLTTTVKE